MYSSMLLSQILLVMAGALMLGYLTEFLITVTNSNETVTLDKSSILIQSHDTAYLFAIGIVLCAYLVIGLRECNISQRLADGFED